MQQQIEDLIDTNAGKHADVLARHAQRDRQSCAGRLFGLEPLQSVTSYMNEAMNEEITSWTGIPKEQVTPVSPVPGWSTQEIVNLTMCAPMGIISKKEGYDYCNLCPRYWSEEHLITKKHMYNLLQHRHLQQLREAPFEDDVDIKRLILQCDKVLSGLQNYTSGNTVEATVIKPPLLPLGQAGVWSAAEYNTRIQAAGSSSAANNTNTVTESQDAIMPLADDDRATSRLASKQ